MAFDKINKIQDPFNRNLDSYNHQLTIFNQKKQIKANFLVLIANNDEKRRLGLMFVKNLAKNHGMLFTFDKPQIITMWMKNTFINLDMIFIDNNNQIVKIAHNQPKKSLEQVSSDFFVDKVLEINAKIAKKLNIEIGDFIEIQENENL